MRWNKAGWQIFFQRILLKLTVLLGTYVRRWCKDMVTWSAGSPDVCIDDSGTRKKRLAMMVWIRSADVVRFVPVWKDQSLSVLWQCWQLDEVFRFLEDPNDTPWDCRMGYVSLNCGNFILYIWSFRYGSACRKVMPDRITYLLFGLCLVFEFWALCGWAFDYILPVQVSKVRLLSTYWWVVFPAPQLSW